MKPRISTAAILLCVLASGDCFLLPILFPVQIKITFTRKERPPPKTYHFETLPFYKEIVVKATTHPQKQSYGDGYQQHTSYGDGHVKVYHEEPYVKEHKYASGYGTTAAAYKPTYTEGKKTYVGTVYDTDTYPEVSHPPVAPPETYEDISEEHKKLYIPQYHKRPTKTHQIRPQYDDEYSAEYTPAYHGDARYVTQFDDASEVHSTKYKKEEPLLYAGFGSTIYGDSYAKIVYTPKPVKISISAYSH